MSAAVRGRPPGHDPRAARQLAVPAQDGVRRPQQHTLPPRSRRAGGQRLELAHAEGDDDFLPASQAHRAGLSPLQDAQLLAQGQDLEVLGVLRLPNETEEIKEEGDEVGQHGIDHGTSH